MVKLTESEEFVMKAVWDSDKEPVLSDVVAGARETYKKDWMPQTVSTFLAKLVQKKYLKLQRKGKIYTYKILIKESAYKQKLYKHLIDFWYNGDASEFVLSMIQNGDLSKEQLDQLVD
ncbi:MAG: BlaI/MecI/CopY family transcriptional regulator [Lachnospiraceae bacterium]|nr:BlaI/MecI/CopY family transcriptional regulator [Lachnospiraceae bacterium]